MREEYEIKDTGLLGTMFQFKRRGSLDLKFVSNVSHHFYFDDYFTFKEGGSQKNMAIN